ncbi:MAG: cation-translocating P-type ATPase [Chamaesiphon sp.]|nr:cation-translocating P-type ATPase [Chamaesiphon sp.]
MSLSLSTPPKLTSKLPVVNDLNLTWHTLTIAQTLARLETDDRTGLTDRQIAQLQQEFGANELVAAASRQWWQILLDQFTNIMLVMLLIVAVVSGIFDFMEIQAGKTTGLPYKDTIAILSIVILNGILGYFQESRAEQALAALKQMAAPKVRVLRDSKISEIDGRELVPGDLIHLEAGNQLAADARLIEAVQLQIRESALTGEATASSKTAETELAADTPLGDRINLVYQGTEITTGRGVAVVTATGMNTELGKIAALLQGVESQPTPLQQKLTQLGNVLVMGALVIVALTIVGGMLPDLLRGSFNLDTFKGLVKTSLSVAVAVVPEGLPAVITITLAMGTQRMVKRQALIRKLPAVETLGGVTIICSDKTGTLTQNKMVVQQVATLTAEYQIGGEGYIPNGEFQLNGRSVEPLADPALKGLLWGCALCNDAVLQYADNQWQILGDPTEGALLVLAHKAGIEATAQNYPRIQEYPFDSDRQRMSIICEQPPYYLLFAKGSPESILDRSTHTLVEDRYAELTEIERQKIRSQNASLASQGLRVLGFAYRYFPHLPDTDEAESELIWVGLVGMLDAPRPEVRAAVDTCKTAGIRTMMITGDHPLTAMAIGTDLGITQTDSQVVSGNEIAQMDDPTLAQTINRVSVYARVAPEHKLRIVKALQQQGELVAMTGDGVNDAPALKQADIGVAMGITGTDVSKEASDMVLLDDNFNSIVAAVEEGRIVYTNIRRFIKYILGSNIGEILTIAAAPLIGLGGVPLSPLQILWMNLVTDGIPAVALALEPGEPDVMQRPPFQPSESIFARGLGAYIIRIGLVFGVVTIGLMKWAFDRTHAVDYPGDPDTWKTIVFTTLCIAQMGHALAVRSVNKLVIEINPFSNPLLLWAILGTILLQLAVVYIAPLRSFFGTHPLSLFELGVCFGCSLLIFLWIEGEKLFVRWFRSKG